MEMVSLSALSQARNPLHAPGHERADRRAAKQRVKGGNQARSETYSIACQARKAFRAAIYRNDKPTINCLANYFVI
jgi:hypothetical protein